MDRTTEATHMMNPNEALGLPSGSVRALITFALLVMLAMTIFYEVPESMTAVIAGLTGSAVTSYFHKGDKDE